MSILEQATEILTAVGGDKNIISLTHCVTRLRFVLKDEKKVDQKRIEQLPDVLGVQKNAGQYQVIVGAKVEKYYGELLKLTNGAFNTESEEQPKKAGFNALLETLSAILIPSLPPVIGGGMIKGFLFMFWQFGWLEWGSPVFEILNIISDGMFYYYPFLLAVSAARRFKTNEYMALALAGTLMYPSILQGATEGIKGLPLFNLITVPYIDYSSSVIPIILSVWVMSYIFRFFKNRIPDLISTIFTPMLTLLIIIPIELIVLAPAGFYVGEYIAKGMQVLIDFSPILSGFVIGATRPFLVLTGTHHAMRAIVQQQISTYGFTTIGAMNYMSVIAQASAALGVFLVTRNKKMKNISFSSTISGFLGVTEPALYGVIVKYKIAMIATMIGGGVAAAITAHFGSAEYAMVMSSILTIPATFGKGFIGIVIGLPIAAIVTIGIILLGKKSIIKQDEPEANPAELTTDKEVANQRTIELVSPVTGVVQSLSTLSDKTFANEVMGKGIAIEAEEDCIKSPINGKVNAVFPTKHAIGLVDENGVEILLHIGIDTVNLKGQYFDVAVKQGDTIQIGDTLLNFNQAAIKEAGYNATVIMIVTNSQTYLEVLPSKEAGEITNGDKLLTILA
ncbi:beta-glucoside-specific PTS transporter subunit IIABC [Isobaculum melis]|uniref:PTS system sucrose-specific EIIBCA component n=1 Tax=Isobaculum melis TaxID=142588 RepID=A0A1H9PV72_9LACT|nr:beta-glucoside-specific PTS transporter subunit IIABC [Isobaculum melis]SER52127.1 PTS system, beta-glucosides-specific IIC component [Isobaculum melis]